MGYTGQIPIKIHLYCDAVFCATVFITMWELPSIRKMLRRSRRRSKGINHSSWRKSRTQSVMGSLSYMLFSSTTFLFLSPWKNRS